MLTEPCCVGICIYSARLYNSFTHKRETGKPENAIAAPYRWVFGVHQDSAAVVLCKTERKAG